MKVNSKLKSYRPTTPSRRHMTTIKYKELLSGDAPYKPLLRGKKAISGRNHNGRITVPHKGGGHKRKYRMIDTLFNKRDISAKVETIEYDPNRSAFISLVVYTDGERRYILASKQTKVGDTFIVSTGEGDLLNGNRMSLKYIPVGTVIYNAEMKYNGGAAIARSAGSSLQVAAHDEGITLLKMPSGEIRKVSSLCFATIGEASNPDHHLVVLGKAGRSRWKGIRPTVRGSAMNPVDHPHGGGEGRQGIGLRRGPKTKYGKLAYGVRTRAPKKYSRNQIVSRRKTKR
jgi:large subunit ribosomal protein L2